MNTESELFEAFHSAFRQLVRFWLENGMDPVNGGVYTCLDREGKLCYHTLPVTLRKPKKEKIQAFGFPYQIEF